MLKREEHQFEEKERGSWTLNDLLETLSESAPDLKSVKNTFTKKSLTSKKKREANRPGIIQNLKTATDFSP